MRDGVAVGASILLLSVAVCFGFYPAWVTVRTAFDPKVRETGTPGTLPRWYLATSRRYQRWAEQYLQDRRGESVDTKNVAETEWPLFGTVFLLVTGDELIRAGRIEVTHELRGALDVAARVVVDPSTGAWARAKWGPRYLDRENVFYRMLVVLGLSSYERATGSRQYHEQMTAQATALHDELLVRPNHLADDYPGECYPSDVLWAAAAVQRAFALAGLDKPELGVKLMGVLDSVGQTPQGLPAFQIDARTLDLLQVARGSGNSGILSFAAEVEPVTAQRWFQSYVAHFWQENRFIQGFRETAHGAGEIQDVDSGPVLWGLGSVASAFGIGAARSVGRIDHAAPLTMQAVAATWPTPFGLVVPGLLGWAVAGGWCFGELALQFSMTRPMVVGSVTPYSGSVPWVVWGMVGVYLTLGTLCVARVVLYWKRSVGPLRRD